MTPIADSRNPWPTAIMASFAIFISGAAVFITWAVRQNMDLVQTDYYEEEIRFQQRLDSLNRTWTLQAEVGVTYDAPRSVVEIALPKSHSGQSVSGRVHFYRPADARLDHEVALVVGVDGTQRVDVKHLQPGLWKTRLTWKANGVEYCSEKTLALEHRRK